jgi:sec-independent protein translocase protein TatB
MPYHGYQNMPSFQDSAVIFFIALLLFGPKKLPELARYVGKLMNEFRRASSDFRMQMDDEFRQIEQVEHQKKIAAMEAAAPPISEPVSQSLDQPITPHVEFDPDNPYIPPTAAEDLAAEAELQNTSDASTTTFEPSAPSQTAPSFEAGSEIRPEPLPIASNGDLHLMPPETGLPVGRSNSIGGFTESIPAAAPHETETPTHG